jgi:pimeloyl-ACP methyl ester carboxylesterase
VSDATADLRTVSWGDQDAPNTALLVHGLTGARRHLPRAHRGTGSGRARGLAHLGGGSARAGSHRKSWGPVGIPAHSADLVALMDREGLDRVAFVGHSLGAMIGVYLAANHPEMLSRLVLVDGGSDVTDEVDALPSPVVERLERTNPSREAYVEYLKGLPDFEDRWDENLKRCFAGDVRPADGEWRHHADLETVRDDRERMHSFPISVLSPRVPDPRAALDRQPGGIR